MIPHADIQKCAELIKSCSGLLIAAGAGMGVDSGLPDFRGDDGFWRAYPHLGRIGMSFGDIANPRAFAKTPELAWGFYGHRWRLYRETQPHDGFRLLHEIGSKLADGCFVFTSNVDGHFQKAGVPAERIYEIHGSINFLQCTRPCSGRLWSADDLVLDVDEERCLLTSPLPRCPKCNAIARPNILMFNDQRWLSARSEFQGERMTEWKRNVSSLAIIELGAGTAIPSVRRPGEYWGCPLIRVNPKDWGVRNSQQIGIPTGALEFLTCLHDAL